MKILIAEDDAISRVLLQALLRDCGHEVIATTNGLEAMAALEKDDAPPLAIIDWVMPGLNGTEICRKLSGNHDANRIYTILLTSKSRKIEIVEGLDSGADDYLVKPFDPEELKARIKVGMRIIELQKKLTERVKELEQVIVERDRAEEALRQLALSDELTGLYNRRGFFTFAEHFLKLAVRTQQDSLLYYVDMDGLKQINDTLGHAEGSLAIKGVADVLRKTFRHTDIIARIGGDEFVILATATGLNDKNAILERLKGNFKTYNGDPQNKHHLSVSFGVVGVAPSEVLSIEALIIEADQLMYEEKRRKKTAAANIPGPVPDFEAVKRV
jgi:diguanylate cyclase (GGDEF)-like protein